MRWLIWVVAAAALAWAGWWYAGSRMVLRAVDDAFAGAAAAGLDAGREAVAVRGFPNRWDLTLTAPRLSDPAGGFGWQAPFVQVFALTWKPWHLIVAFAPEQSFTFPGAEAVLRAGKLQGSLVAEPSGTLPLDRAVLAGEALALTVASFAPDAVPVTVEAATASLALRRVEGAAPVYELGLAATGVETDGGDLVAADLPRAAEALRLDAFVTLDAPLDRNAGAVPPRVAAVELREAAVKWGDVAIAATGRIVPDAAGAAEGRIDVTFDNWERAIDLAVALGMILPEVAPTWREAGRRLTEGSPAPQRLVLPLVYGGGFAMLGPLPIGPAPRLRP